MSNATLVYPIHRGFKLNLQIPISIDHENLDQIANVYLNLRVILGKKMYITDDDKKQLQVWFDANHVRYQEMKKKYETTVTRLEKAKQKMGNNQEKDENHENNDANTKNQDNIQKMQDRVDKMRHAIEPFSNYLKTIKGVLESKKKKIPRETIMEIASENIVFMGLKKMDTNKYLVMWQS